MTATSIGGINKDLGFGTAPMRGDNSFLGASKLNYGDDLMGDNEHSTKV
jgi:hypothetical protein